MDQTTEARIQVNVGVSGADQMRSLEGALKNVEGAGKKTKDAIDQLGKAHDTLGKTTQAQTSTLGTFAAKWLSVGAAIALATKAITDTAKAAKAFDDSMDRLALQSGKTGAAFKQVSEQMRAFTAQASTDTIYTMDQVAGALIKLKDRGFDVYSMTKEQLRPVLDAAAGTMQDLAEVADSAGATMQAFGMDIGDLAKIADIQTVAFREAGLTAQQFGDAIQAAGAVAAASGQSLESYTAVVVRLKQLGMDAGQFQKLFFSAMENPTAQQLRSMRNAGVDPFKSATQLGQAKLIQQGIAGAAGAGASLLDRAGFGAFSRPLTNLAASAGAQSAQSAAAEKDAASLKALTDQLIALANQLDRTNAEMTFNEHILRVLDERAEALTETNHALKASLKDVGDQVAETKDRMGVLQGKLQGMLNPNVSGLAPTQAYKSELERLNDELKDHQEALDGTKQKYETLGNALEKARSRVQALQQKMQDLRSAELVGEQGFNDQEFGLQQQIAALQLQKSQLGAFQMFEGNALDQQIAALQRQLQQTQLQRQLTIDPERKRIEDAVRAAEGATPMTADEIIAGIGATDEKLDAAQRRERRAARRQRSAGKAVAAGQAEIDQLSDQILATQGKLEDAMAANEATLERIRTKAHEAMQALGLEDGPMTEAQLLATIGSIQKEYGGLQTQLGDLTTEQHAQEHALATNERQLAMTEQASNKYKGQLDELKRSAESLKETIAGKEEEFGGLNKMLIDQEDILAQIAGSGKEVSLAYDIMGKRGGAMMVALLGEDGKNVDKLYELKNALVSSDGAAGQAEKDTQGDIFGAAEKASAALKNLQIQIGTDLAGSMDGLTGAVTKLTTAINSLTGGNETGGVVGKAGGSALNWTPFGPLASAAGFASEGEWGLAFETIGSGKVPERHARGGIVGGYGYQDSVPAMLTPGEEVLTRNDPRHRANGGGTITVNVYNPTVRNEHDIQRLASAISKELAHERARVRAGMPA